MEPAIKEFLNYGVLGALVVITMLALWWLYKSHRDERKAWIETTKEIAKEGHQAIRDNTSALIALKVLLETTRDKR